MRQQTLTRRQRLDALALASICARLKRDHSDTQALRDFETLVRAMSADDKIALRDVLADMLRDAQR